MNAKKLIPSFFLKKYRQGYFCKGLHEDWLSERVVVWTRAKNIIYSIIYMHSSNLWDLLLLTTSQEKNTQNCFISLLLMQLLLSVLINIIMYKSRIFSILFWTLDQISKLPTDEIGQRFFNFQLEGTSDDGNIEEKRSDSVFASDRLAIVAILNIGT